MICFLCIEQLDGVYVHAVASFATDADRQFANRQRQEAGDNGAWFSERITDKPFNMTALPFCIIPNERKATKQQIMLHGATNTDSTATNAYVRNGNNRLNQLRQFAYDGRYWYYQPGSAATGEKFRKVDAMDIPEPVINDMANYIGTIPEKLKERD